MMKFISKKELVSLVGKLENAIDRFMVVGLYYGLAGTSTGATHLLNIKKEDVDFTAKTITLEDRVVKMDSFLEKIVADAIAQTIYIKMGEQGRTNEDYELSSASEYIIRVKPTKANAYGTKPLTLAGFKTRLTSISNFLGVDATQMNLKKSGAFNLIQENNITTVRGAEELLKPNGLSIRRNNILEMLKTLKK